MSARQDFPPIPNGANAPGGWGLLHLRMCDEIDRLRLSLAWWERIAQDRGEENERLRARVTFLENAIMDEVIDDYLRQQREVKKP